MFVFPFSSFFHSLLLPVCSNPVSCVGVFKVKSCFLVSSILMIKALKKKNYSKKNMHQPFEENSFTGETGQKCETLNVSN